MSEPVSLTENFNASLKRLYAQPCRCVSCATCHGTGEVMTFSYEVDEFERCPDYCSGGITEVCDRCAEIEEISRAMVTWILGR